MVSIGSLGNSEVEASGSTTVTFHTWIAKRDLLPYEVRAISKHRGQCTVTQRPNPALLLVLVNKALFYLHMGHGGFQGSSWRSGAVVAETLWPGKSKRVALSLFQIKCASPGIGGQSLRPRNMSLGGRFTGRKTGFLLSLPGARAACPHCPDCAAGVSCSPQLRTLGPLSGNSLLLRGTPCPHWTNTTRNTTVNQNAPPLPRARDPR